MNSSPNDKPSLPVVEHVKCNLCGADDTRLVFPGIVQHQKGDWEAFRCTHTGYGHHLPVVECRRCGMRYANPRFTEAEILSRYEDVEDPVYLEQLPGRLLTFDARLRHMERFTGPSEGRRLLDVGAYVGACVQVARDRGWDAHGIEPGHWAVSAAQSMGLNVQQGTMHTNPPPPASFDVVTSWDVIEHLTDPLREVHAFAQALKPGGWLAIHTMDCASPFARLMGKRWPWLMEMHLYYFNRRTLTAMLELAGFEIRHIYAESRYLRLDYLASRIEPYSPCIAGLFGRVVRALRITKRAIPVNFGDLMTVYARKQH